MPHLPGNITHIPHFVEAPSLEELQRRMLQRNVSDKAQYQYFDIQKDNNRWVAFYYKTQPVSQRASNDDKSIQG